MKKRIWTILVESNSGNPWPLCDIVYCDHVPTVAEVKTCHPHLADYDENDFDIAEYTDIPTIL